MRLHLLLPLLLLSLGLSAQSNRTIRVLDASRDVVKAIFESRDSAVLDKYFARELLHQLPDGKSQGKAEAIRWLVGYPARLEQAEMRPGFGLADAGDSSVVRYFYKGRAYHPDGTNSAYTVNLVMAWRLVKHKPRLFRLQMIKVD